MAEADRVNLAHEPDFVLGRLTVSPARRELVRDDGEREVLEHRVMQVLIALARAKGGIVTRDELIERCWHGRVVGDDAINRVISRLRKEAEGIGNGSFGIETITKIGYRLAGEAPKRTASSGFAGAAVTELAAHRGPDGAGRARGAGLSRRTLLTGATLGAAAVIGGGAFYLLTRRPDVPPEVAALMEQASQAQAQIDLEGQNQSIALYRRVVDMVPDYADGWGALGVAYGMAAAYRRTVESDAFRARARTAAGRSLALDPHSSLGQVARVVALPIRGNLLTVERGNRSAMADHPRNDALLWYLTCLMGCVGRANEAVSLFNRIKTLPTGPGCYFIAIGTLWRADRLDEMDKMIAEAAEIYPTHYALWFQRLKIWMYGGRAAAAVALASDRQHLPSGIADSEVDRVLDLARAIDSHEPAAVEREMAIWMAKAREGNGYAQYAMQIACTLGRLDEAFAVTNAYYFARGFAVPELSFTQAQGSYRPQRERDATILFAPPMRPIYADPRFGRLAEELGLERYWREAGVQPDFRKT